MRAQSSATDHGGARGLEGGVGHHGGGDPEGTGAEARIQRVGDGSRVPFWRLGLPITALVSDSGSISVDTSASSTEVMSSSSCRVDSWRDRMRTGSSDRMGVAVADE